MSLPSVPISAKGVVTWKATPTGPGRSGQQTVQTKLVRLSTSVFQALSQAQRGLALSPCALTLTCSQARAARHAGGARERGSTMQKDKPCPM